MSMADEMREALAVLFPAWDEQSSVGQAARALTDGRITREHVEMVRWAAGDFLPVAAGQLNAAADFLSALLDLGET